MRGQPRLFGCPRCRKDWFLNGERHESHLNRGGIQDVDLTGRTKPVTPGKSGLRSGLTRYEYKCRGCGHVGWSRHTSLARLADTQGIEPDAEDRPGLERYRQAQEESQS